MADDDSPTADVPLTVTVRQVTVALPLGLWFWAFAASLINGFSARHAIAPATASMVAGVVEWLIFLVILRPTRLYFGDLWGGLYGAVTMSFSFRFPKVRPWPSMEMLAIGLPLAIAMGVMMGLVSRLSAVDERRLIGRVRPMMNLLTPRPADAPRT